MQNLNNNIDRIKGMMKMISESDFSIVDQLPNQNPDQKLWELKSIVMYVLADFSESPYFEESDINLGEGYFVILDNDLKYELRYDFDVNVTRSASYDPGDYETAPYYEGTEWEIENLKLTITELNDGDIKEIYSGPDISEFEKMLFPPVKANGRSLSGGDMIYNTFDEKINELDGD